MNLEIERKYLLKKLPKITFDSKISISQYYFPVEDKWERIRESIQDGKISFIHCVKKLIEEDPAVYEENERDLTVKEYLVLREKCTTQINKIRHVKKEGDLKWEIDEYVNLSLIVAEIEIPSVDYQVEIPDYISENLIMEVTSFREFTNRKLSLPI